MTPRRGAYGFDAAYVPLCLGLGGALLTGYGLSLVASDNVGGLFPLVSGASLLASAASYVYTTLRGKFVVWSELLERLALRGDERVLDVGCGRGAVLLLAAERIPRGRATGIDLWRGIDQTGNDPGVTEANAAREGVGDRVELVTGDMRQLPFPDASFDLVTSSLAVHNVPDDAGRARAVVEMWRVLAPGGRLLLADIRHAARYAEALRDAGATEVTTERLPFRFWYGGPHFATTLVRAAKPAR